MILDRQTDAITAGLTSLRLVLAQPGVMLVWGALIAFLFLHERLGIRRWLGAAIVAVGAGLIAFA